MNTSKNNKNQNKYDAERRMSVEEDMDAASDSGSGSCELFVVHEVEESTPPLNLQAHGVRKRLRSNEGSGSGSESAASDEEAPASKVAAARRGRGRPPTTGKFVGLRQAKEALRAAEKEDFLRQSEDDLSSMVKKAKEARVLAQSNPGNGDGKHSAALKEQVLQGLGIVEFVSKKSGNLKGTYTKALKEATALIAQGTEGLKNLTASEEASKLEVEVRRLQEANKRLTDDNSHFKSEYDKLRQEVESLRVELRCMGRQQSAEAPPPESELLRLFRQEMASLTARFAVIEGKILRPPLAGDRKAAEQAPSTASYAAKAAVPRDQATSSVPPMQASTSRPTAPATAPKKTGAKNAAPKATQPQAATSASKSKGGTSQPKGKPAAQGKQTAANPQEGEWQTVSNRKKKSKASKKSRAAKLRAPRSSAVVITLQPEAEAKGVTYASILTEAKQKVDLAGLGIPSLRFKRAITGARILEIPGAETGDKADSLAAKLREFLSGDEVKISRPSKTAELRVSGLDDSVTSREIGVVAAQVGGCTVDEIKVGEVRIGPSGLGTAWMRCPVAAAKTIANAGHILVGWVSAAVSLLDPRPMQCYRCLYGGHVRHTCASDIDRSDLCYRCSQPGHKRAQCSADPHCSLCAAAGKPASHQVGAKSCVSREKRKGKAGGSNPRPTLPPAEQAMEVSEPITAT